LRAIQGAPEGDNQANSGIHAGAVIKHVWRSNLEPVIAGHDRARLKMHFGGGDRANLEMHFGGCD
jgi:hypothetical protein